jgi:hypothetical protein
MWNSEMRAKRRRMCFMVDLLDICLCTHPNLFGSLRTVNNFLF